jgi:hypothetical protein
LRKRVPSTLAANLEIHSVGIQARGRNVARHETALHSRTATGDKFLKKVVGAVNDGHRATANRLTIHDGRITDLDMVLDGRTGENLEGSLRHGANSVIPLPNLAVDGVRRDRCGFVLLAIPATFQLYFQLETRNTNLNLIN